MLKLIFDRPKNDFKNHLPNIHQALMNAHGHREYIHYMVVNVDNGSLINAAPFDMHIPTKAIKSLFTLQ